MAEGPQKCAEPCPPPRGAAPHEASLFIQLEREAFGFTPESSRALPSFSPPFLRLTGEGEAWAPWSWVERRVTCPLSSRSLDESLPLSKPWFVHLYKGVSGLSLGVIPQRIRPTFVKILGPSGCSAPSCLDWFCASSQQPLELRQILPALAGREMFWLLALFLTP